MLDLTSTGMMVEVGKFSDSAMKACTDDFCVAVTPDEAAESLIKWVDTFNISHTGEYWAPRGPRYGLKPLEYSEQ